MQAADGLENSKIISVSSTEAVGLYNPYTTAGDLVVNGILASSHSSWFLEGTGLSDSSIVATYGALFKPLSWLQAVKPESFHCFHKAIVHKWPTYVLDKIPASFIFSTAMESIVLGCDHAPEQGETV